MCCCEHEHLKRIARWTTRHTSLYIYRNINTSQQKTLAVMCSLKCTVSAALPNHDLVWTEGIDRDFCPRWFIRYKGYVCNVFLIQTGAYNRIFNNQQLVKAEGEIKCCVYSKVKLWYMIFLSGLGNKSKTIEAQSELQSISIIVGLLNCQIYHKFCVDFCVLKGSGRNHSFLVQANEYLVSKGSSKSNKCFF